MLPDKVANKTADFPGGTGVELVAQRQKLIALSTLDANKQLRIVFGGFLFFRFFRFVAFVFSHGDEREVY